MSAGRISNDRNRLDWFGDESDTKPTLVPTEVRDGSRFTELDTGKVWVFYHGVWQEDLTLIYALSTALAQQ